MTTETMAEYTGKAILQPDSVAKIIQAIIKAQPEHDQDKEQFFVLGLDTKNQIKYIDLAFVGSLNSSLVHPREVFTLAVGKRVNSIIVAHNHPSGSTEPSPEDKAITDRLIKTGEILGIKLKDSVITGKNKPGFYSFSREGFVN